MANPYDGGLSLVHFFLEKCHVQLVNKVMLDWVLRSSYHKQKFPRVVDSAFLNLFLLIQQYFDGPYITLSVGFKDKTKFSKNVHLTNVMGLIIVKFWKRYQCVVY
jgi:hypothetical protein